jgi:hypothetical protein
MRHAPAKERWATLRLQRQDAPAPHQGRQAKFRPRLAPLDVLLVLLAGE